MDTGSGLSITARVWKRLSPLSVLLRGYSITYRVADRKVIRSYAETGPGDRVLVRLADGRLECLVDKAEEVQPERER